MADPQKPIVPFQEFLKSVQAVKVVEAAALPGARVRGSDEFEKMRQHILTRYRGIQVPHSFMDENGQIFDCVPIEEQGGGLESAEAATPPQLPEQAGEPAAVAPQAAPAPPAKDQFGNVRVCPAGTIPMRRITPEDIARFPTLERFFRKGPLGGGQQPSLSPPAIGGTAQHKYAHAAQSVNNLGGHSILSVWSPSVDGSQFSLSQHWYAANTQFGVQTAEVGWQVYPQLYGHSKPALFVYWTADGYQSTGSYNLTGGHFVQTNSAWTLGGSLSPVSSVGGQVHEIEISYFLQQGKWWLYINKAAIGYYRASQYGSGQLATSAAMIDYGGETVGAGVWPAMGSGQYANAATPNAASHRDIYYYAFPSGQPTLANLTPQQLSPGCYTINTGSAAPPWNRYFYYGGPGGSGC